MKLSEITQDNQLQNIKLSDIGGSANFDNTQPIIQQPINRLSLKSNQPYNSYDYGDAINDTGKTIVNSLANLGDNTIGAIKNIPQIPNTILQTILHPIITGKAIGGAIGEKIGQYNTMDKFANKVSSDPFGYGSDVVNTALMAKGLIGIAPEAAKLKVLMPKAYNDALVAKTGQSIVDKVTGAVKPLKEQYKTLTEPFIDKPVDSETFQKALSIVPLELQKDLTTKYGTAILDANGKPQTNLGKLHSMELNLKDEIAQPKYAQSINAESYDIAKAVKQIKQIRLSQYPQGIQDAISILDKKFGPVIDMSNYLLPKVSNKAGAINTKTLYGIFNNPADAGTRDYLTGLRSLGVDLTPEMNTLKGWVGRQRSKSFIKNMTGKAVEGGALGTILKGGAGG